MEKPESEKTSQYLANKLGYKILIGKNEEPEEETAEEDETKCKNSAEHYFCK